MAQVLERWLFQKLGLQIDLNSETIGQQLSNGTIYYKILVRYNILDGDLHPVPAKSKTFDGNLKNLRQLGTWLKLLGVTHDEQFLSEIADKNRPPAVQLLFELFTVLEEADRMTFTARQRTSALLTRPEGRFRVTRAKSPSPPPKQLPPNYQFEASLLAQGDVVSDYKEFKDRMKKEAMESIKKRREKMKQFDFKDPYMIKPMESAPKTPAEDPITVFESVKQMNRYLEPILNCSPEDYVALIRVKREKAIATEVLKQKLYTTLLHDMWSHLLDSMNEDFTIDFKKKLLQKCYSEKMLSDTLTRLHDHHKTFTEVKNILDEEVAQSEAWNDIHKLSQSQKRRLKEENDAKRVMELHGRILEEKYNAARNENELECRSIVNDLVDLAIRQSEFAEQYRIKPPPYLISGWKQLVIHRLPILREPRSFVDDLRNRVKVLDDDDGDMFLADTHLGASIRVQLKSVAEIYGEREEVAGEEREIVEEDDEFLLDAEIEDCINFHELRSYLTLTNRWDLEQWPDMQNRGEELRLIGFIVHRLLSMKYNLPGDPPTSRLGHFKIRAVLEKIQDSDPHYVYGILKILLKKAGVALVTVNDALNFCLEAYQNEIGASQFGSLMREKVNEQEREKKEKLMKFGKFRRPSRDAEPLIAKVLLGKLKNSPIASKGKHKSVQVPHPENDPITCHSWAGKFGKMAYETLCCGDKLNEVLLCKMLIEYLRSLEEPNGFVLIDFPSTANQAYLFEYLLTGRHLQIMPEMDDYDQTLISATIDEPPHKYYSKIRLYYEFLQWMDTYVQEKDEEEITRELLSAKKRSKSRGKESFASFRISPKRDPLSMAKSYQSYQEMPDPKPEETVKEPEPPAPKPPIPFELLMKYRTSEIVPSESNEISQANQSFFTKYLHLIHAGSQGRRKQSLGEGGDQLVNKSHAYQVYENDKAFVTVSYSNLDKETIQRLARLILGESARQLDSSDLLEVNVKAIRPEDKVSSESTSSGGSNVSFHENNEIQKKKRTRPAKKRYRTFIHAVDPYQDEELGGEDEMEMGSERRRSRPRRIGRSASFHSITNPKIELETGSQPVTPNQTVPAKFINDPIEFDIAWEAASIWEVMEYSYVRNLERIFYLLRKHEELIAEYIEKTHDFFTLKDDGLPHTLINNFQLMYNSIDHDTRSDPEIKEELHVRVWELEDFITGIYEEQVKESEEKRQELVVDGWVSKHAYTLINLHLALFQTELDRLSQTLAVINDYYGTMTEKPIDWSHWALSNASMKISVPKLHLNSKTSRLSVTSSKKNRNSSAASSTSKYDPSFINVIPSVERILSGGTSSNEIADDNPFYKYVTAIKEKTRVLIRAIGNLALSAISGIEGELKPKTSNTPLNGDVGLGRDLVKQEWKTALENEIDRCNFRIDLIEARAKLDTDYLLDVVLTHLNDHQNSVFDEFQRRRDNLMDCMQLFREAIEAESPIQCLIVFDGSEFYVDRKIFVFPQPGPPDPLPLEEEQREFGFTIGQIKPILQKLRKNLNSGEIFETTLIQQFRMIADEGTDVGVPSVPQGWLKVTVPMLKQLFTTAFGDQTSINWQDFIQAIDELPRPTIEDLIMCKKTFEQHDPYGEGVVSKEVFMDIPLWFELNFGDTLQDDLRFALAKDLLYEMFQIDGCEDFDYTSMLLSYCKSEVSEDGFGLAVTLFGDTPYVLDPEKCARAEETTHIPARVVVDWIIHKIAEKAEEMKDSIRLDYLPKPTNEELYASQLNEYEESENILKGNKGERRVFNDIASSEASSESIQLTEQKLLYDVVVDIPEKYTYAPWTLCISYEFTLSLLTSALNFYGSSDRHQHRYLEVEKRLKQLFADEGTGTHIRVHRLVTSDFFSELFETTKIFKLTNLVVEVENLLKFMQNSKNEEEGEESQ